MTQEELFYSIFENIPRQGPGTKESTLKAFSAIKKLPANAQMLDIGCGKGTQTFDLAEVFPGTITAVDNHPAFVDFLNKKARKLGLQNRIKASIADMNCLPFSENQFDIIWAEGSIFITGLENGLKNWRKFLKDGGNLVLSETAWFCDEQPEEIKAFWDHIYPYVMTIPDQKKAMENCGYTVVESFKLPKEGWWINYYSFLDKQVKKARTKYQAQPELSGLLDALQHEKDMYERYGDYYGYVFSVLKKE